MGMGFPNNRHEADDSYHALSRVREEFFVAPLSIHL
jgi:hypothetical protein